MMYFFESIDTGKQNLLYSDPLSDISDVEQNQYIHDSHQDQIVQYTLSKTSRNYCSNYRFPKILKSKHPEHDLEKPRKPGRAKQCARVHGDILGNKVYRMERKFIDCNNACK